MIKKLLLLLCFSLNIIMFPVFAEITQESDFIRLPIEYSMSWNGFEGKMNIFTKKLRVYKGGFEATAFVTKINDEPLDDYLVDELVVNKYIPDITYGFYNDKELKFEDGYAIINNSTSNSRGYSALVSENGDIVPSPNIGHSRMVRLGRGVYKKMHVSGAATYDEKSITFTTSGEQLIADMLFTTEFINGSAIIGNELWIDKREVPILYNGNFIKTDEVARLENGTTMVPVRAISEALGFEVDWDEDSQTVTVSKGSEIFTMQIDNKKAYKNSEEITLQVAPYKHHNRTFIPLRAVSEALGFTVEWKAEWNMAIIL